MDLHSLHQSNPTAVGRGPDIIRFEKGRCTLINIQTNVNVPESYTHQIIQILGYYK